MPKSCLVFNSKNVFNPAVPFGIWFFSHVNIYVVIDKEDNRRLIYISYRMLYNNQINTRALIGQLAVGYCAVNPRKNRVSSKLIYKSNRPQVSMVYRLINHLGPLAEHSKNS